MTEAPPSLKRIAGLLTAAGVLPFIALAIATAMLPLPTNATAALWLAAYATAILSFLGGIRWGIAVADPPAQPTPLVLSVLSPLAGFALLPLYVTTFSQSARVFLVYALLFVVQLIWDWRSGAVPAWFKPMRMGATLVAVLSLVGAWAVSFLVAP